MGKPVTRKSVCRPDLTIEGEAVGIAQMLEASLKPVLDALEACRLERRGEGLSATVGFRLEPGVLVLEMLDESAFAERVDEI